MFPIQYLVSHILFACIALERNVEKSERFFEVAIYRISVLISLFIKLIEKFNFAYFTSAKSIISLFLLFAESKSHYMPNTFCTVAIITSVKTVGGKSFQ